MKSQTRSFNFPISIPAQMNDPNSNDDNAEGDSSSDKGNKLLEEFRQQWRKELKTDESVVAKNNTVDNESCQKIDEDKVNLKIIKIYTQNCKI